MLDLIKFKLLLKKYKNVFSDILGNMSIKESNDNIITFIDNDNNEMIAQMNNHDIIFEIVDKRHIIVNLPEKYDYSVKVIDTIKEKKSKGCIIEKIEKNYDYTKESPYERVLVDLISKRYVFENDIQIEENIDLDELCKMKTVFESHMKTLIKPHDSIKWYTTSPYSTITMIDGKDISYIYDIVNGNDKIYRIYDLYNGIINERNSNDIFSIHLGLLRKEGLGYKETSGITKKEDTICGKADNIIEKNDCEYVYNLVQNKIGYKNAFDCNDIESLINAITYQKTSLERTKEAIEKKLFISYENFDKLDFDEQRRLIKQYHKKNPSKKSNTIIEMIGSGENSTFIKVKKGEKIMLSDGTFVEAGLTEEESRQRLEDKIDDMLYTKPVAFVKKLTRKIKNK
jgi:hypothetical protein